MKTVSKNKKKFSALLLSLAVILCMTCVGCGRSGIQDETQKAYGITGEDISPEFLISGEESDKALNDGIPGETSREAGASKDSTNETATDGNPSDVSAAATASSGEIGPSTNSSDGSGSVTASSNGLASAEDTTTPSISLIMVGDILLHTPVEKSAKREDGTYSYDAIFADTKDLISAADLALVNQEVILGGKELGISGYPAFNAPYEVGDDLVEAGFDVICHATNHALDKGKRGV